ncbi:O-antigen ligase family protein [Halogranum amylolyticum]|nr:O-antigen ligase family protein [Halogranum amylolyticum]
MVVVPVAGWAGMTIGAPKLVALLGAIAVVGGFYGLSVLLLRQLPLGLFVSLLVLSTFAANIPLASNEYIKPFPGSLGPQLWLVQLPLIGLIGYFLFTDRFNRSEITSAEYVYAGFVGWTLASALLTSAPRQDVALYFSLLMLQGFLVFSLSIRAVTANTIDLRTALYVLGVTVSGHALFGIIQLVNQGPVGLTYLGESIDYNQVAYEPLGLSNQVIVSGFTGHGYVLVALSLLTVPVLVTYAMQTRSWRRLIALVDVVFLIAIIRLSTSDAGRGAGLLIMFMLLTGVACVWMLNSRTISLDIPVFTEYQRSVSHSASHLFTTAAAMCLSLLILFYPSSKAGATSNEGTTPSSGTTGGATGGAPSEALSVPFFDLSNFGIRIQQYLVGFDLFVQYPLFGIGGANFAFVATDYGIRMKPNSSVAHALHNIYFALLAETGLPSLVLYVSTIGLVIYAGWRVINAQHNYRLFVIAFLIGMVGFFAFGFWTHAPIDRITAVLPFWILAGCLVGTANQERHSFKQK